MQKVKKKRDVYNDATALCHKITWSRVTPPAVEFDTTLTHVPLRGLNKRKWDVPTTVFNVYS